MVDDDFGCTHGGPAFTNIGPDTGTGFKDVTTGVLETLAPEVQKGGGFVRGGGVGKTRRVDVGIAVAAAVEEDCIVCVTAVGDEKVGLLFPARLNIEYFSVVEEEVDIDECPMEVGLVGGCNNDDALLFISVVVL